MSFLINPYSVQAATSAYSNVYSIDFDGTDDYIDTGVTCDDLSITNQMTCSFWAKGGSIGAFDTILGSSSVYPSNTDGFGFYFVSNTIRFYINSYNAHVSTEACTLNDGNWWHIVGTYDGDSSASPHQIKVYANAVVGSTDNHSSNVDGTILIGKGAATTGYIAPTQIDEVAVWNVCLTQSEVTELYNSGVPTNLDDFSGTAPKAWWRMGDGDTHPTITDQVTDTEGTMTNMVSGDIEEDVPS